jgi:hypothetical protein
VSSNALATKKPAVTAFFKAVECTIGTYLQGDYHQNPAVVAAIASASQVPASSINNGPAQFEWPVNLQLNPKVLLDVQKGWLDFGGGILTYTKPLTAKQLVATGVLPKLPSVFQPAA